MLSRRADPACLTYAWQINFVFMKHTTTLPELSTTGAVPKVSGEIKATAYN